MERVQAMMEAATEALSRNAKGVFGNRIFPDRATPFDPGEGRKVLPAVCLYAPSLKLSTEGRATARGVFVYANTLLTLEVWAKVPSSLYAETHLFERAQAKALRLAVQACIDALFTSNDLLKLCSQVPMVEIVYGQDVTTQARVDAAIIRITFTEQSGQIACISEGNAVPLKSLFLDVVIPNNPDDPTDQSNELATHSRYLDLDKE